MDSNLIDKVFSEPIPEGDMGGFGMMGPGGMRRPG